MKERERERERERGIGGGESGNGYDIKTIFYYYKLTKKSKFAFKFTIENLLPHIKSKPSCQFLRGA